MRGAERGESGFTVVETLIALVIIGVALLLGMALLLQQPRVLHRIDAQRQALRAIESTIEALRAGLLPLEDAEYDGYNTAVGASPAKGMTVDVAIEPSPDTPNLYKVHVEAHYKVAGQAKTRAVDTYLWRQ